MMRNKFRGQQCGVFEKSLRCGSVTGENPRKGQWTEGPWRNKNTDLKVGTEFQEQGEGTCERKHGVFYTHKIKKIMDEILQEKLSNQSYDSQRCPWLCMSLSEDIKGRVKELGMERFRLICNVSIGSNNGQGFFMASKDLPKIACKLGQIFKKKSKNERKNNAFNQTAPLNQWLCGRIHQVTTLFLHCKIKIFD